MDDLVLIGDFFWPGFLDNRRAASGEDGNGWRQPVQLPIMGMTMQDQVDARSQPALQSLGIPEILIIDWRQDRGGYCGAVPLCVASLLACTGQAYRQTSGAALLPDSRSGPRPDGFHAS